MKHLIRPKLVFKRCLRRFPSSSQIIRCLSKETPPCDNKGSLMKTNTEWMSLTRKYCQPRETLSFPLHKLYTKALTHGRQAYAILKKCKMVSVFT